MTGHLPVYGEEWIPLFTLLIHSAFTCLLKLSLFLSTNFYFPLSCGRGDLGWLGVWLLARVIPPQSFLVPNVWPEITTALIRLCAVAVVAVNWQDSVLVMEFACFTVYLKLEASGHFWILLFSGLLITLFCCACDHVDKKKNGHALHLCWHMAQAWIVFFCWVSYLENEGLHLPSCFWHWCP